MPPVTRSGMPPVARSGRPNLPPTDPPFDQDAFDEALTDPGPFGRMAFETRPPMRPASSPPATEKIDTDDVDPPDDDLFTDEDHEPKPPRRPGGSSRSGSSCRFSSWSRCC